jgi:transcriptional regulator with XRE-family HTH domain
MRGESVEDVAPKVGLAPGSLRNIENMRGPAGDLTIAKLAEYLKIDESALRTLPPSVKATKAAKNAARPVLKARSVA